MILRRLLLRSSAVWLGLGPLPQLVQAQERRWISILHSGFPDRTPIHLLFEALRAHGFEDGRSATVELLGGEGDPERLKSLIAQLTSQKPDVIIALTPPAALGLKQAGTTIPVVFADVPDPVGLGLVNSLARPGGNFGLCDQYARTRAKDYRNSHRQPQSGRDICRIVGSFWCMPIKKGDVVKVCLTLMTNVAH